MPRERIETYSVQGTLEWAATLGRQLRAGHVLALTGDLGTGKTVIAKGVGRGLGVHEEILSPTFNYLIEYQGRTQFFHADLYRITDAAHFRALGLEEYFEREGVLLLEWAERIGGLVPPHAIRIEISRGANENDRIINMTRP